MRNEITIKVDWTNVATELPPIPSTNRGEGRRAPQETLTTNSK